MTPRSPTLPTLPTLPEPGVVAGRTRPGEVCCQRALAQLTAAGGDGDQTLPGITGCALCRRSILVATGVTAANLEARARARSGSGQRIWPPRGLGLDCPYLAHPSNQHRPFRLLAGSTGSDTSEVCQGILS
ncbi:MAG TPA: hypothetical protein VHA57_00705 [Actinomycetota bacterium]|nr:hypothetical protein [Actinomycetota bacterium]